MQETPRSSDPSFEVFRSMSDRELADEWRKLESQTSLYGIGSWEGFNGGWEFEGREPYPENFDLKKFEKFLREKFNMPDGLRPDDVKGAGYEELYRALTGQ